MGSVWVQVSEDIESSEDERVQVLAEGAWRLALPTPTLPPATSTNTLILGEERLLVVEPATPDPLARSLLLSELVALAREGREVVGLAITHHHIDHIGFAEELRQRLEVPLYAHPETAERLSFAVDETIDESWSIDLGSGHKVEALFTPGHAPGHLVFWDTGTGVVHGGDLVAGEGTIVIEPEDGGDMATYLDSLERMAQRVERCEGEEGHSAIQWVPAHGDVPERAASLLRGTIRHRLAREEKVLEALREGKEALGDLLARAYDDKPASVLPLAVSALRAHLNKLVAEKRAKVVGRDCYRIGEAS